MKLREELEHILRALNDAEIPYALCGGLAMAVHGWPRATMDIDIMVESTNLDRVLSAVLPLGYSHKSGSASFAGGKLQITRVVKMETENFVPLDILAVTSALSSAWESREMVESDIGPVTVVSSHGLVEMKKLRNSGVDQDDIHKLEGGTNDAS